MDSPFEAHPNYDPDIDAMVGNWVLATRRLDWAAMSEADQAEAYMDFFVTLSDEDCAEMLRRYDEKYKRK